RLGPGDPRRDQRRRAAGPVLDRLGRRGEGRGICPLWRVRRHPRALWPLWGRSVTAGQRARETPPLPLFGGDARERRARRLVFVDRVGDSVGPALPPSLH